MKKLVFRTCQILSGAFGFERICKKLFFEPSKSYQAHLDFKDFAGNLCSKPNKPYEAHLNFKNIVKNGSQSLPNLIRSNLKPSHLNFQISSLTKFKNLKSQISNLKSSILNSQTSNLKISNPKSLGVGGMSRRR